MRLLLLVFAFCSTWACTRLGETPDVVQFDSAGVALSINPSVSVADTVLIDAEQVGSVGANEPDGFSNLIALFWMTDSTFAAVDQMELRVRLFDLRGQQFSEAGRLGEGPGEFKHVAFGSRYGVDSLLVYDSSLGRFTVFDSRLDVAHVFAMVPSPAGFSPSPIGAGSGVVYFAGYAHEDWSETPGAHTIPIHYFRHEVGEQGMEEIDVGVGRGEDFFSSRLGTLAPTFGRRPFFFTFRGGYGAAWSGEYEVRLFDNADRLIQIVRRVGPLKNASREKFENVRNKWLESVPAGPVRERFEGALSTMPFLEYEPAFGRLGRHRPSIIRDPAERLWVLEYDNNFATVDTWAVYGQDGALSQFVTFPDGVELYGVSRQHLLTLRRTELGVQIVTVYRAPE